MEDGIGSALWRMIREMEASSVRLVQWGICRCSCAMFETLGVLCQHALYILKKKKVMELPEQ